MQPCLTAVCLILPSDSLLRVELALLFHRCERGGSILTPVDAAAHTSSYILLVSENEQKSILHFTVLDDACKFGAGLLDSVAVIGVDDEDKSLSAFIASTVSAPSF